MKKLNLILASALVVGALVVNAQDSGTSETQDRKTQDRSGAGVGTQGQSQDQDQGQSQDQTGSQGQSGAQDQTGSQANPTQGTNPTQGATGTTGSQDYQKDMTVIKSSEVPTSLRNTLGGGDYQGWENNSTIYRNRSNDQFVVEMRDGNQTKIHRFDKDGRVLQGQDQ
jgi:hypothetical protein